MARSTIHPGEHLAEQLKEFGMSAAELGRYSAYTTGTVGTYLSHGRLKASYPAVFKLLNEIHAKRYESNLSHARIRRTQQPTKRIRFKWLAKGAALLRRASDELATKFPAK